MIDCQCGTNRLPHNNKVAEIINIDFGYVGAGKIGKKTVKIANESSKKKHYVVNREKMTNPLDHVFEMESDNWILLPGRFFECRINYQPIIPSRVNVDYFDVTDCDYKCYKISVRGNCIGPRVVPSVSRLLMICPKEGGEIKKRLQLKNLSDVAAIFMFDFDQTINDRRPFKLDLITGIINPNSHVYVTVTFATRSKGLFVCYLPCLIQYQEPLITEIIGYRGSSFSKMEEFNQLIFSESKPLTKSYSGYMNDSVQFFKDCYPPITISDNHIDFGNAEFEDNDNNETLQSLPAKTVSLINRSDVDFNIEWDKDVAGIFQAKPRRAILRGRESAIFQFTFSPDKKDALFSREFVAQAFWRANELSDDRSTVPIPLVVSFRAIGQSFTPGSAGWIPQYEIPQVVILPPSIPATEPAYTNFMIKLRGHLPITFRFITPTGNNRFVVKPMVGIIRRDYQVVTVQFFPHRGISQCRFNHTERWAVRFNGNSEYECPIVFQASVESPDIIIGDSFKVRFPPVHPCCEQTAKVTMRNPTRHCIEYSFTDLPAEIIPKNKRGIISANEILTDDWIFCSKEIGDHLYKIDYRVSALKDARYEIGNSIFNLSFEIEAKVEPGYLVALPDELNFGIVPYGRMKSLSFNAFNFSSVNIPFKLICKQRNCWPIGNAENDVEIRPIVETLLPRANVKVDVDITPSQSGFYQLIVQYLLRSNSSTNAKLSEPRDICRINCMCVLPGFEVKDLIYVNENPESKMSKSFLWNLLEIDNFNAIVKNISPGDKRDINFRFPELVAGRKPLVIKMLILNSAPILSNWNFKRVKKCDCKLVLKNRGFNFTYKEYNCDHRLACTISPKEGTIQPHGRAVITIKICYVVLGKTNLQWELKLSDNRIILINADVVALSENDSPPSLLIGPILHMEKTYIGDIDAANQIYWMFNPTDREVNYSFDIRPFERINIANFCRIFHCENPNGFIPRNSYYPVIFKFQPRRFEAYRFNVPLKIADLTTNLSIDAEADVLFRKKYLSVSNAPRVDQFSVPEVPVSFSTDEIIISSMPLQSNVNRMITIFNDSKNEVLGYRWESYELPGVIGVEATPSNGRIQPNKAQTFCIKINSRTKPCNISNINLSCQFIDLSAQRAREKYLIVHKSICEQLAGQFSINEKGIEESPKLPFQSIDKPLPFYKSLAINCHVYSSVDTDLKITVDEQLTNFPSPEIQIKNNETLNDNIQPKMINIANFIMEGMMWDILNSNAFIDIVKDNIAKVRTVKYASYKISPVKRRRLTSRCYNVASKRLLESIFEQMIFGIVHEEFGLSMYHFNGPEDIRQFHYQRRDPRLRQRNNFYDKSSFKEIKINRIKNAHKIGTNSAEFNNESQVKFNVEDKDEDSSSYD